MPASVSLFFFFFLQAQALFLVRDEWTKFEYVMKIMHRAPFEVLNFRDHSIPLWGKALSVLGRKTPFVHAYVVKFSYQARMEFKCEPPLFPV